MISMRPSSTAIRSTHIFEHILCELQSKEFECSWNGMNCALSQTRVSTPTSSSAVIVISNVKLCEGFEGLAVTVIDGGWSTGVITPQSCEHVAEVSPGSQTSLPHTFPNPLIVLQSEGQVSDDSPPSHTWFPQIGSE